jgi:hypothetical protein
MHYPDQRYASPLTVIRRECVLPEDAVGTVRAEEGQRVDVRDVVANGVLPSRHIILDAMEPLGLKDPADLEPLLHVEVGDVVDDRDFLAGKNQRRGRRLFAPVRGVVSRIENGRIFLRELPEMLDIEAGVRGRVVSVQAGRSVVIEAVGAQMQGVWGNNRRTIATLRVEPEAGMMSIEEDEFDMRYRGAVMLTASPLEPGVFGIIESRGFVGVIAPSMDFSMIDSVLQFNACVLLTEGFGQMRMNRAVFSLLSDFEGQQVTLDASMPGAWEARYPEVIVNIAVRDGQRPRRPNPNLALREGMTVRITRDPHAGQTARVVEIPNTPLLLENGLRVSCARVELLAGGVVAVPVNNLETLGR